MNFKIIISLFFLSVTFNVLSKYDLTLMGRMNYASGLRRIPITIASALKDQIKINFYNKLEKNVTLPNNIKNIPQDNSVGNVLFYADILWDVGFKPDKLIPKAKINIAYSMLESTIIPQKWVEILNNRFDLVAVPDQFLVDIYKKSGVNIPIFVLPIMLDLDLFLRHPIKKIKKKPFVFGMSGEYLIRKDHKVLLRAFSRVFKNNPDVKLILHGRHGFDNVFLKLKKYIKRNNIKNVQLIKKVFTQNEYLDFFRKLDCYVLASKGEGFSVTPRESLAMGIPCILSDNTAHSTICDNNFIYRVPCYKKEKIFSEAFPVNMEVGDYFSCTLEEVAKALKHMHENYHSYLSHSNELRQWATLFSAHNLKTYYRTLIKPKSVILGNQNVIEKDRLITNSLDLFNKYQKLTIG